LTDDIKSSLGPLHLPVLLIAFRRHDTTLRVIEALRNVGVTRIYFACDGGRNEAEWAKVNKVRSLIDQFDWPCELQTRFNDENKGCRVNPSESIYWFFEHEEEGIILEDDILPDISFFYFCQELLEKYRHDNRIWSINGSNSMSSRETDSYYFSSHGYGAYWGWATWRRSWEKFDLDIEQWPRLRDAELLDSYFLSADEARYAKNIFNITWNGFDSWDYQFDFAKILNNAVNIIPSKSLTHNVGIGHDATHTVNKKDINYEGKSFHVDFPLIHPEFMLVDENRELYYFRHYIKPPLLRRVKNIIKALLPEKVDRFITKKIALLKRK
jgi:hypothetical protein